MLGSISEITQLWGRVLKRIEEKLGEKQIFDKQQLWEQYYLAAINQIQTEWSFDNESAYHVEEQDLSFLE